VEESRFVFSAASVWFWMGFVLVVSPLIALMKDQSGDGFEG